MKQDRVLAEAAKVSPSFFEWLSDNFDIYVAFEREARNVADLGFKHYSARTIVEVLRHHQTLREKHSKWKLNDHITPYLARLFMALNPSREGFFETRRIKGFKPS